MCVCVATRTIYGIHYAGTAAEDWPSISINKNTDRSHKSVLLRFVMFPSIVSYKWQAIPTIQRLYIMYVYVVRSIFPSKATSCRVRNSLSLKELRSSHVYQYKRIAKKVASLVLR